MQRPLLILVAVLVVIAAVLFAVLQLDGEPSATPDGGGGRTTVEAPMQPGKPAELESDRNGAGRTSTDRAIANTPDSGSWKNGIEGRVLDGDGQPIRDAAVTLTATETGTLGVVVTSERPTVGTRTNSDGRFDFRSIEPRERYLLAVESNGHARFERATQPVPFEGVVTEPVIVLSSGATLSGTVRDEKGAPIANATLFLDGKLYALRDEEPAGRLRTQSNEQGEYFFAHVAEGQRALTVTATGFGVKNVPGLVFERDTKLTRDVVLAPGLSIAGKAVTPDGLGIADARIIAVGMSVAQQSGQVETKTNAKGEFVLESLLPGKYNVIARAKGWRFASAQTLETNTKDALLRAVPEARVCGTVVDADSGAPVREFHAQLRAGTAEDQVLMPLSDTLTTFSGSAGGEFCIENVQATIDGGYVVEVLAPGYAPGYSRMFSVAQGELVERLEIRLGQGGRIVGRLIDPAGKPVANALVETRDNDWSPGAMVLGSRAPRRVTNASTRTDGSGAFALENLAPDTYQIAVEASGFSAFELRDLRVALGEANDLGDVRLPRGGAVRGKLLDRDGKGVAGGQIELLDESSDRPRVYRTTTAGDGTFEFVAVTPGAYVLHASASRNSNPLEPSARSRTAERNLSIAEGDDLKDIEIRLAQ